MRFLNTLNFVGLLLLCACQVQKLESQINYGNVSTDSTVKELNQDWVPRSEFLVSYWKFDGHGYATFGRSDLRKYGTPGFSTDSFIGTHSAAFNGQTDYFSTPPVTNFQELSVSLWVKINSWTGTAAPLLYRINGHAWYPRLSVSSTGTISFQYRIGPTTLSAVSASGAVPAGQWYHFVATLSPSDGSRVYLNGALVAANPTPGTAINSGSNEMLIGRDTDRGTYLDGRIDDLGIWDVVLNDQEVRTIYEKQSSN